jgi:hypothetical protein
MHNMKEEVTLEDYKKAMRRLKHESSKKRVFMHFLIFAFSSVMGIIINIIYYPDEPWILFPFVGWAFGFFIHYVYGIKWIDHEITEIEAESEYRAKHKIF